MILLCLLGHATAARAEFMPVSGANVAVGPFVAAKSRPGAAPDSAAGDSSKATGRGSAARMSRFAKPRWVMLRSLAVPGWGQAYNRAWIKAAAVAVAEVGLGARVVNDQKALNQLASAVDRARASLDLELEAEAVAAYNRRLDASLTRQVLLGVVVGYALVDAYVDAHFRNFKIEFETDPALPGGIPPDVGGRVGWEWSF